MSMLEADSGPRHGHMLLQILQEDMPLRLEYPPPTHTHTELLVNSELLLVSQVPAQKFNPFSDFSTQPTPHRKTQWLPGLSLLSPARFAYLPAQGLYHNDSSTRPRDPQRLGLRPGISRT